MGSLFCVLGRSGSGKTTFLNDALLRNKDLNKVVYCTTRKKRDNETNGEDYYFYTEEEYSNIDPRDIIESREYIVYEKGEEKKVHYFTLRKCIDIDKDSIMAISPYQYKSIREYFKDDYKLHIYVIFIYASNKNRVIRSLNRISDDRDVLEVCRRIVDEEKEFKDVLEYYPNMYNDENCLIISNNFSDIGYIESEMSIFKDFKEEAIARDR